MTMTSQMTSTELCQKLKKQAFHALDTSKRGTTVRVPYNELIDLCIAFQQNLEDDYSDLEYSLKVAGEENRKLAYILDKILDHASVDSKIWDMACGRYLSYEGIDAINRR